jgi:hypothetical protein
MTWIQDFFTSRRNDVDGQVKIGEQGRLWYEPETNTIRVWDGNPGDFVFFALFIIIVSYEDIHRKEGCPVVSPVMI